jgi:xylulokinase
MSNPPILLGIDLGTSSVKCLAIEPDGKVLSFASRDYPILTPQPGWAEQDPLIWKQAAFETIRECLQKSNLPAEQVSGIGLAGQMHGLVVLDESKQPLRPAIIWADQRSQAQVAEIYNRIGAEKLAQWAENPLATGFMLPSWLWLCENEPEISHRARWLLLPKDYLRLALTGEIGSEPSDASSTLLFNPAARGWSHPLLEALNVDSRLLPPLGESAQIAGRLRPAIAQEIGLPAGLPVVYGGSDQALQAVGHGILQPGLLSSTIGTGGQLFAPTLQPDPDPGLRLHLFCHAAPALWHLESAILSAGLALKWLRDRLLVGTDYASLANLALQAPPGSEDLLFLPYLAGERTPWMDPEARGAFIGLTLSHHRAHLIRSVMEGVVFALRQGLELMVNLGIQVEKVIASGGAVQHPLWLQLQADIFNRPIYRTDSVEAAAMGAALLAATGVGLYPDIQSACRIAVHYLPDVVEPNPTNINGYAQRFDVFARSYPAVKNILR